MHYHHHQEPQKSNTARNKFLNDELSKPLNSNSSLEFSQTHNVCLNRRLLKALKWNWDKIFMVVIKPQREINKETKGMVKKMKKKNKTAVKVSTKMVNLILKKG